MKNDLFRYLKQIGVFKNNGRYESGGSGRILASERTELKRAEKNRLNGIPYSKKEWGNILKKLQQRKAEIRKNKIRNVSEVNN